MEVVIEYGYNVIKVLEEFKTKIKKEIENLTTMNVQKMTVMAKGIHVDLDKMKEEEV